MGGNFNNSFVSFPVYHVIYPHFPLTGCSLLKVFLNFLEVFLYSNFLHKYNQLFLTLLAYTVVCGGVYTAARRSAANASSVTLSTDVGS